MNTTLVPCWCGEIGCTAILREGDKTFYEEGDKTFYEEGVDGRDRDRDTDASLHAYMLRRIQEGATMYPASDDWCPSFPGGLVSVRYLPLTNGEHRVGVWGVKITQGMIRDFPDKESAIRCKLRLPVVLSRQVLLDLGFEYH